MLRSMAVSLASLLSLAPAMSQSPPSCEGVLELAGRDTSLKTRNLTTAEELYSRYCAGKTIAAGIDISVPMAALVEGLPPTLVGTAGGRIEKMQSLCSTYESWRALNYSAIDFTSSAVREAIAAWSSCKSLANKGIYISTNAGPELLQISMRRGQENAFFKGITVGSSGTSDAVSCKFRQAKGEAFVETDPTTLVDMPFALTTGEDLIVNCRRPSRSDEQGNQFFDTVEVNVDTSRGGVRLPWYKDTKYGPSYASAVAADLARMNESFGAAVQRLEAQARELNSRLEALGAPSNLTETSEVSPWNHGDRNSLSCPVGSFAAGVNVWGVSGGGAGARITNLSLYCRKLRP